MSKTDWHAFAEELAECEVTMLHAVAALLRELNIAERAGWRNRAVRAAKREVVRTAGELEALHRERLADSVAAKESEANDGG